MKSQKCHVVKSHNEIGHRCSCTCCPLHRLVTQTRPNQNWNFTHTKILYVCLKLLHTVLSHRRLDVDTHPFVPVTKEVLVRLSQRSPGSFHCMIGPIVVPVMVTEFAVDSLSTLVFVSMQTSFEWSLTVCSHWILVLTKQSASFHWSSVANQSWSGGCTRPNSHPAAHVHDRSTCHWASGAIPLLEYFSSPAKRTPLHTMDKKQQSKNQVSLRVAVHFHWVCVAKTGMWVWNRRSCWNKYSTDILFGWVERKHLLHVHFLPLPSHFHLHLFSWVPPSWKASQWQNHLAKAFQIPVSSLQFSVLSRMSFQQKHPVWESLATGNGGSMRLSVSFSMVSGGAMVLHSHFLDGSRCSMLTNCFRSWVCNLRTKTNSSVTSK